MVWFFKDIPAGSKTAVHRQMHLDLMRDSYEIHSVSEVHKVFAKQCVHMFTHACGAKNLQVSKMSVASLTKNQTLWSLNDHSLQSQGAHQVLSRAICFCCMSLFFRTPEIMFGLVISEEKAPRRSFGELHSAR